MLQSARRPLFVSLASTAFAAVLMVAATGSQGVHAEVVVEKVQINQAKTPSKAGNAATKTASPGTQNNTKPNEKPAVDLSTKTVQDCPPSGAAAQIDSESDGLESQLNNALNEGQFALALLLVLFGGLLTALSPCVYPLIPITLSIFGARQAQSKLRGFLLSSTYVAGMVVLYTTLGTAFAAFGFLAGSALQSPIITIGVALFCIVMAASMFGAFEFALPAGLQNRLNQVGGTGFKGTFAMGLVAGIIAAPCTGPVLSFILTLIAKDGNIAKGGLLMFFYALGMGLPFLVLGTFSSMISRMPKSGGWMDVVKSIFGVLMLVAGLYYLQFGIPAVADLFTQMAPNGLVLGAVLIVVGTAAGAFQLSFKDSSTVEKVRKGVGVLLTVVGLLSLIAGATAAPEPVAATASGEAFEWHKIDKNDDQGVKTFDTLLAQAKSKCQPVMIDFFAQWCAACKELDKYTYPDAKVTAEVKRFVPIKIDATEDTAALTALQKRFGIVGLPTVVFLNGNGVEVKGARVTGFMEGEAFLKKMRQAH